MNRYAVGVMLLIAGCGVIPAEDGHSIAANPLGQSVDVPVEADITTGDEPVPVTNGESEADVDQDTDGLSLNEELLFGTSDLLPDTDLDGLSDFDEIRVFGTDPLSIDTDADGLEDYEEIMVYGTNPTQSDSDFDGLSDTEEIRLFNTDPLSFDTDSDGLFDVEELRIGTDPRDEDTDGDGISDYDEWVGSTNPLDPTDPPPPIVPGDLFSFLTQEQADALRSMQAAGNLRAGRGFATCQAQAEASCASRGTCGGGTAQAAICGCGRPAWELSIQEFEDALLMLLDQIDFTMTSGDREEVSAYMHASYDRTDPCWLSGTATCTWVSFLCSW